MEGAKIDWAAPVSAVNAATAEKLPIHGSATDPSVTRAAAATSSARLAVVASTKAPAGVCASRAATPPMDITMPIEASSQFWTVSR